MTILIIVIATVAVVCVNWKTRSDGKDFQTSDHQETDASRQKTAGQPDCKRLSGSTYYELLGVDRNATAEMIKEAWRKKDYGQYLPIELRRAYQSAYRTLSSPEERRKYDAKPWKWNYEEKPDQRQDRETLPRSFAVSKRGRQAAVSSADTTQTSWRKGATRDRGIGAKSGRLSGYSYSPRRAYGGRSSYALCRACRWRQRTIGSGRARSIRGVSDWASANCTCR